MERDPISWPQVMARIDAHPVSGTPGEMRDAFEALTAGETPSADRLDLGGIEALAVGEGPETLLWFHGGGGVFGSPESHLSMAQAIADAGVRVILPRYRLAPEHSWPAMLEDARTALTALNAALPSPSPYSPASVGGCSFGGHLALALAVERPHAVGALALLSPNTLRVPGSATRGPLSIVDAMNDDGQDAALADMALGDADRSDPLVSPALAEVRALDFPSVHLEVGGCEVLLDDALILARNYASRHVDVELHVSRGAVHLEALWPGASGTGRAQLARIGRFVSGNGEAA